MTEKETFHSAHHYFIPRKDRLKALLSQKGGEL